MDQNGILLADGLIIRCSLEIDPFVMPFHIDLVYDNLNNRDYKINRLNQNNIKAVQH
ncbi:hypothetical protein D3C71_1999310 [compost metagenome]